MNVVQYFKALGVAVLLGAGGLLIDWILVRQIGRSYWSRDRLGFLYFIWPWIAAFGAFIFWRLKKNVLSLGAAIAGFVPSFCFFVYILLLQISVWFDDSSEQSPKVFFGWVLIVPFASAILNSFFVYLSVRRRIYRGLVGP